MFLKIFFKGKTGHRDFLIIKKEYEREVIQILKGLDATILKCVDVN